MVLLEVGIGGLLDYDNVVTGGLAVITSVGLIIWEREDGEAIAQQERIFKKGQKSCSGPYPMTLHPFVKKAKLAVDLHARTILA